MNDMTHTGIVSKVVGFGKLSKLKREFRETKNHYIDKDSTKFSKKTGNSLSGWKCQGIFIGETLDLSTIELKQEAMS